MAQGGYRLTTDSGPRFEQCLVDAGAVLRSASKEWAKGDPEDPPTEEVLKRILRPFEKAKFLRRPW